jgi:hypothetical protein
MKFLSLIFTILWICFNSSVLHADSMYSWTDENGVMNLSNRPPPGNARDIKVYNMLEEGGDEKGEVTKDVIRTEPEGKDAGKAHEKKEAPKKYAQDFMRI